MFEWLRESTWDYPIIGAIHVLGIAWFGGTVLIVDRDLLTLKRIGFAVVFLSGALLFALQPARYYGSFGFLIKMLLLLLLGVKLSRGMSLALWIAIIFASRAIAFF